MRSTPLDPLWLDAEARAGVLELLDRIAGRRVLVYGDLVCDVYLHTEIDRVSREAPVLIVRHREREMRPGGGANAAANVGSLGGTAQVVGPLGEDEAGHELADLLGAAGCGLEHVLRRPGHRTALKTRVLASAHHGVEQQVLRIDDAEPDGAAPDPAATRRALEAATEQADAVLVSDYGLGAVAPELVAELFERARERGIPRLVDSRHRLPELVGGATLAAPNEPELEEILGLRLGGRPGELAARGSAFLRESGMEALVVTQGSAGMTVLRPEGGPVVVPVFGTDEVADVTGAGDTVAAALALAMAAGAEPAEAARLATVAAGLVVMKQGTSTVSAAEVREALGG